MRWLRHCIVTLEHCGRTSRKKNGDGDTPNIGEVVLFADRIDYPIDIVALSQRTQSTIRCGAKD